MCSSRPGRVETSTGPRRRSASITSSTSTSGADAPAVRPTTSASLHPFGLQLAAVRDQVARDAFLGADLAQPVGIGGVLRADHQDHVDQLGEVAHGRLAVLRRVADVARLGPDDVGELALQRLDDALGVVDAERGLRHIGDRRIGRDVELVDFLLVLHQHHRRRRSGPSCLRLPDGRHGRSGSACGPGRHSACPDCAPW